MSDLIEIQELKRTDLDLLEALGISDRKDLASQEPAALTAEIKKANGILKITKRAPSKTTVTKWIKAAGGNPTTPPQRIPDARQAIVVEAAPTERENNPVDYEKTEQVIHFLEVAPFAIPVPGKIMMENQLKLADIPGGLLLNRYSGDLDIRISEIPLESSETPTESLRSSISHINTPDRVVEIKTEGSTTDAMARANRTRSARPKDEEDRVSLIRTPRESTNRGKDPRSRTYVRGVLHPNPWGLRVGAVFTLLLLVNLPLAMISCVLLLLTKQSPDKFSWVPEWILAFPLTLPVVGLIYLIWGFQSKCRICTQKLFVHSSATKHAKSHRLPGLGYVVPLGYHLLIFSWFRCSSCGTPIRLKR